jgi:NADP-dependent 3-hydroxy acid dehydrogenase YdfG
LETRGLQLDITSDASVNAAANIVKDVDVLINNGGMTAVGDYINNDPGRSIRPGEKKVRASDYQG